jgi:hypothetical protein
MDESILIKQIMTQTTYSETEAIEKLKLHNNDHIKVIKEYMGIPDKKNDTKVKSVNQEIFRQIRTTFDNSMREYREKNPINMEQVITNLKESDEREQQKRSKL